MKGKINSVSCFLLEDMKNDKDENNTRISLCYSCLKKSPERPILKHTSKSQTNIQKTNQDDRNVTRNR